MNDFMMIDNIPVAMNGEKNILELVRKAGIDLPTFCYYSDLSVYGACRMCMVENQWGDMEAACSTPPKAGMVVYTNTPKLRKYRKNILELLLSNHCRDCTTCEKSKNCKLQELAKRFDITDVRFPNHNSTPKMDNSSMCITRDASKCILCGDCVRMCNEVQGVGAIDFAGRGSKMTVSTHFNVPMGESNCVGCGQCAAVCPTGAIVVKNNMQEVWNELADKNNKVIAQVAPAVRVAVAQEFGFEPGIDVMGKIVAALRRMGFDQIFDTSTSADLTVLEESNEFVKRVSDGGVLPLMTSCCPAWVNFVEKNYPEYMPNVSTCKSPMQMFGAVIKEHYKTSGKRIVNVAIMPCAAKKFEATREEFKKDGVQDINYVLTTQELVRMIKQSGLMFDKLEAEGVDMPFGTYTGAGVIFGVTGGVTEAVIRRLSDDKSLGGLHALEWSGVRGMEGIKECTVPYGGIDVKVAVVSGLANADALLKQVKSGEKQYHLIEVMACPGGCVAGAGQPLAMREEKRLRGEGLYRSDKMCSIKRSEENPLMSSLYNGLLKGKVHELLHVHYGHK